MTEKRAKGDLATRLLYRIVSKMQRGMAEGVQESLKELTDELAKGTLDPAKIAAFAKAMGVDMSQLSGMVGKTPGFSPYQILGLDKSASDEEVKKRYNELLHKLHPDTSGTEATSFLLQMVMAAYQLIKTERRWQ